MALTYNKTGLSVAISPETRSTYSIFG